MNFQVNLHVSKRNPFIHNNCIAEKQLHLPTSLSNTAVAERIQRLSNKSINHTMN